MRSIVEIADAVELLVMDEGSDTALEKLRSFAAERNNTNLVHQVIAELEKRSDVNEGSENLRVRTGQTTTDADHVVSSFGTDSEADMTTSDLVGGVIVRDHKTKLDASIDYQLERLRQTLTA